MGINTMRCRLQGVAIDTDGRVEFPSHCVSKVKKEIKQHQKEYDTNLLNETQEKIKMKDWKCLADENRESTLYYDDLLHYMVMARDYVYGRRPSTNGRPHAWYGWEGLTETFRATFQSAWKRWLVSRFRENWRKWVGLDTQESDASAGWCLPCCPGVAKVHPDNRQTSSTIKQRLFEKFKQRHQVYECNEDPDSSSESSESEDEGPGEDLDPHSELQELLNKILQQKKRSGQTVMPSVQAEVRPLNN